MMRRNKQNKLSGRAIVGYISSSLLALLLLALIFPVTDRSASAEESFVSSDAMMSVKMNTVISVVLDKGSVDMEMTPQTTGDFQTQSLQLAVQTNSENGYKIMLSTLGDTNSLVYYGNEETDERHQVKAINSQQAGSTFTGNSWGYALLDDDSAAGRDTIYAPVPTRNAENTKIKEADTSLAGQKDLYTLAFGVRVDSTLPAGTYNNTVLVSVLANAEDVVRLDQATYMQQINDTICQNSTSGTERQLYDLRDGNKYWVARTKDGHCWMIQNLALDLKAGQTLTDDLTDLADAANQSWTVPGDSGTTRILPDSGSTNSANTKSWNLGQIVLKNPTGSGYCPQAPGGINSNDNAVGNQSIADTCSAYYQDVSYGWSADYQATATSSIGKNSAGEDAYDARYLIGNYYQYGAATAGTDSSATSTGSNASASICPKGWTLPQAGRNHSNGIPSATNNFWQLLQSYGYSTNANLGWKANLGDGGNSYMPVAQSGATRLDYSPLYFVRGGSIDITNGSLRNAGHYGGYWSRTAQSSTTSYYLAFIIENAFPSDQAVRSSGLPIRCVSK